MKCLTNIFTKFSPAKITTFTVNDLAEKAILSFKNDYFDDSIDNFGRMSALHNCALNNKEHMILNYYCLDKKVQ